MAGAPQANGGELIRHLHRKVVRPGDRWIYSAGFNVDPSLPEWSRVDVELEDLATLLRAGARVAILSHQGGCKDGTAVHLDFIAEYLGTRLATRVEYFPENTTADAIDAARSLQPGHAIVFGNTRFHPGEESNDRFLARAFARLGERVAVGGFSKSHREHASNAGILRYLPGYAAYSLVREMENLAPWAGPRPGRLSAAVLGGRKKEKVLIGLARLAATYDLIIPGGVVLATLLRARGTDVGASYLGDDGEERLLIECARAVLDGPHRAKIRLPELVWVASTADRAQASALLVNVSDGVPADYSIVDFVLTDAATKWLSELRHEGGRAIIAGTPALWREGFRAGCSQILAGLDSPEIQTMLLGGDTTAELPHTGYASTGGGSALEFLAAGTVAVLRCLAENRKRFPC